MGGQGLAGGKAQPDQGQALEEHLSGFVVYLPPAQAGSEGVPVQFSGLCILIVSQAISRPLDFGQSYLLSFRTEL